MSPTAVPEAAPASPGPSPVTPGPSPARPALDVLAALPPARWGAPRRAYARRLGPALADLSCADRCTLARFFACRAERLLTRVMDWACARARQAHQLERLRPRKGGAL
jgi:hypothetical protein